MPLTAEKTGMNAETHGGLTDAFNYHALKISDDNWQQLCKISEGLIILKDSWITRAVTGSLVFIVSNLIASAAETVANYISSNQLDINEMLLWLLALVPFVLLRLGLPAFQKKEDAEEENRRLIKNLKELVERVCNAQNDNMPPLSSQYDDTDDSGVTKEDALSSSE